MQSKRTYLPLAVGVIAVSFAAIFIKLSTAPPLVIASYRMLLASLTLLPIAWWRNRNELAAISRRNLMLMACSGVLLALHFACWISSFQYTSITSSTVLVSTQPIFVAALSWLLFRERVGRRQLLAVLLAILGSMVIGLADSSATPSPAPLLGNLLALLGAGFGAGYFLCGKAVRQDVAVLPYAATVYGFSAIVLLTICLISGTPLYPYGPRDFLLFLSLAIVCTVIGHSLLNWALAFLPATAIGVAVLGEPIGSSLWALAVFSEVPSFRQLLGGGLLLTGILLFMLQPRTNLFDKSK